MLSSPNIVRAKLSFCLIVLFMCSSACTPALNWRDVRLESADGSTLKAALPCKPDTATRKQQLSDIQVKLSMMGCLSNETTFTLSHIPLSKPLDAPKVLTAWQSAAAANVNAKSEPITPITVSGASAWPPAMRAKFVGTASQAHMLWFAKQTATGLTLYQAAVYGKQPSNEAITTFFESLQLP
jgi:hypothetical protein